MCFRRKSPVLKFRAHKNLNYYIAAILQEKISILDCSKGRRPTLFIKYLFKILPTL